MSIHIPMVIIIVVAILAFLFAIAIRKQKKNEIIRDKLDRARQLREVDDLARRAAADFFDLTEWYSWEESAKEEMRAEFYHEKKAKA
ncbi:hypothetical protein [Bosea sp. NBC_00550]|uniref:hypothetical protein n=1 Tax=Bosea sp. NBC_00550 TaxID=2969621 RepID=UPI002230E924|nr:hypothetical protein [Bosea sp. NBC_00550]UZF92065.1 hypothetical protein NWE53_23745 [Bosea sp. NBC_00550]